MGGRPGWAAWRCFVSVFSVFPVSCAVFNAVDDQWQNLKTLPERRGPGEGVGVNLDCVCCQDFRVRGVVILGVSLQRKNGLWTSPSDEGFSFEFLNEDSDAGDRIIRVWRSPKPIHARGGAYRNPRVVVFLAQ